jgi:protein required for attachment to host cells
VQDSTGHHRHRVEQRLTAHQANEEKFLVDVAGRILAAIEQFSAASLILCAPPKALGTLRAALAKAGQNCDLVTLAKDLTKERADQLDLRVRSLRGTKLKGG